MIKFFSRVRLAIVAWLITISLLRAAFPHLTIAFYSFLGLTALYSFVRFTSEDKRWNYLKRGVYHLSLPLSLITIVVLWSIVGGYYKVSFYAVAFLVNILIFFALVDNLKEFYQVIYRVAKHISWFAFVCALLGIIKYSITLLDGKVSFLFSDNVPVGTSLTTDYNFYSLFLIVGILIQLRYLFFKKYDNKRFSNVQIAILVEFLSVILSTSRRGSFIVFILLIFIFLSSVIRGKFPIFRLFSLRTKLVRVSIVCLLTVFSLFLFVSPRLKSVVVDQISADPSAFKFQIASMVYRYETIFNSNPNFDSIYSTIWLGEPSLKKGNVLDQMVLEKLEHQRNKKVVYSQNSNPEDTLKWFRWGRSGFSVFSDSTLVIRSINKNSGIYFSFDVLKGDTITFSALTKVIHYSSSMRIMITDSLNDSIKFAHYFTPEISSIFDTLIIQRVSSFSGKYKIWIGGANTYEESILLLKAMKIEINAGKYFHENVESFGFQNKDFSKGFKGWSIWNEANLYLLRSKEGSCIKVEATKPNSGINQTISLNEGRYILSAWVWIEKWSPNLRMMYRKSGDLSYKNKRIPFNDNLLYNWIRIQVPLELEAGNKVNFWVGGTNEGVTSISYWTGFSIIPVNSYDSIQVIAPILSPNGANLSVSRIRYGISPERAVYSKIPIYCDPQTVSIPAHSRKLIHTNAEPSSELVSSRIDRWAYAWELFWYDYNFPSILLGTGFAYTESYAHKFLDNPNGFDYPHNPLISAFLYSGIVGGLLVLAYILMVFKYYVRNNSNRFFLVVLFLTVLFFIFFSANTIFDQPIFCYLLLAPQFYLLFTEIKQHRDK